MKKYLCILLSALLAACGTKNAATPVLPDAEAFETTVDGKPVALYTLANSTGFTVQITNFGARVVSILAPDRNGRMAVVAVGCESIGRYLDEGEARFSDPSWDASQTASPRVASRSTARNTDCRRTTTDSHCTEA